MNDETKTIDSSKEIRRTEFREVTSALPVSEPLGGLRFETALQMITFAEAMSKDPTLRTHLRGNIGTCLRILDRALAWHMNPWAVADKSYVISEGMGVSWESQLVHAVIEQRAPITTRLNFRFEGDGDDRKCFVYATFEGETEPREWPPKDAKGYALKDLRPPIGDKGVRKGSPLWDKKPDLQLFYNVSRDWARVYCPDVLDGIYAREEIETGLGPDAAIDVTPPTDVAEVLHQQLIEAGKASGEGEEVEGFREGVVEEGLNGDLDKKRADRKPVDAKKTKRKVSTKAPKEKRTGGQRSAKAKGPTAEDAVADSKVAEEEREKRREAIRKPALPETAEEYIAYLKARWAAATDPDELSTQWFDEIKLRRACGVDAELREKLRVQNDERVEKLRGEK